MTEAKNLPDKEEVEKETGKKTHMTGYKISEREREKRSQSFFIFTLSFRLSEKKKNPTQPKKRGPTYDVRLKPEKNVPANISANSLTPQPPSILEIVCMWGGQTLNQK